MGDAQPQTPVLTPATTGTPRPAPRWHVVLLDDNEHSYEYVIEMLTKLFQHDQDTAYRMACEVDRTGRVIVATLVLEQAEFKRDQILAYGPDWRIEKSRGSMRAVIEPAPS